MIPQRLRLKNFLSHEESVIDFSKFNAALILGTYDGEPDQSNGAGKSAIFEAITWALFGKSRHKKKDGVVKRDCKACAVELEFEVEDHKYKVIRSRDKTLGDSDIGLGQWDGSEYKDISCDTNTATDKKILEVVNITYDVFINSVYFKQNDISMFAESTPSRRKDVLKSLLRMEKWDAYQKKAKDKVRTISAQIEEKAQNAVPLEKLREDLAQCKRDITSLRKDISASNKLQAELQSDLMAKKLAYQAAHDTDNIARLKDLKRELNQSKKRLVEIESELDGNNKRIAHGTGQIATLQQKIKMLKNTIRTAKDINLEDLRSKTIKGKTKERLLYEKVADLAQDVSLKDECYACNTPLSNKDIQNIRERRAKQYDEVKLKHKEIKEQLIRAQDKLSQKENIVSAANKAELEKGKIELKISKLDSSINEAIEANKRLVSERTALTKRKLQDELDNLVDRMGDIGNEEEAMAEISSIEAQLPSLRKKIDKLNVEYGSKVSNKEELIKLEAAQVQLKKELANLKNEHLVHDKLRTYFGKDGVQAVIIENVIEELENYANETLAKICNEPTAIAIKTQKQNDNGSWAETFDIEVKSGSQSDDFEAYSGGEKFRVSLALRLALSNILAKRMGGVVKFLLLDEVSSNLDAKGISMFISIIKNLSEDMKILIITHDDKLKEKFDDIIMVDKSATGSTAALR